MTDIDYEKLAKALYTALNTGYKQRVWERLMQDTQNRWLRSARAVVAALADQRFAVAPMDAVRFAVDYTPDDVSRDELIAALLASPDVPPGAHRLCPALEVTETKSEDS